MAPRGRAKGHIGTSIVQAAAWTSGVNGAPGITLTIRGELAQRLAQHHQIFGVGGGLEETIRELLILALESPITQESVIAAVRLRALAEARAYVYERLRNEFANWLAEMDEINTAAKEAEAAAQQLTTLPR
jgi:hypothetical protein